MGFDSWDKYQMGDQNVYPGPVDNSGLLKGSSDSEVHAFNEAKALVEAFIYSYNGTLNLILSYLHNIDAQIVTHDRLYKMNT